jgi:hypothetical protein
LPCLAAPSLSSTPNTVKLTRTLFLSREVAEQLAARAIAERRNLEDLLREILEQAAQ